MPAIGHRISEKRVKILALFVAASRKDGFITTSDLKRILLKELNPYGGDSTYLKDRNDVKFTQIIRNIVSHRHAEMSIFNLGYAEYVSSRNGIQITPAGRNYLASL